MSDCLYAYFMTSVLLLLVGGYFAEKINLQKYLYTRERYSSMFESFRLESLGLTTVAVDFIYGHGSAYFYVPSRNLILISVDNNNSNMSHRGKRNQIGSKALSSAVIKGCRGKTGFRLTGYELTTFEIDDGSIHRSQGTVDVGSKPIGFRFY